MNFNNQRFLTKGVAAEIDPLAQLYMWKLIDEMKLQKDYLQIFELSGENGKQKIIHIQEEPEYRSEHLLETDAPIFIGKIYVIDDETHSTMLLASEY